MVWQVKFNNKIISGLQVVSNRLISVFIIFHTVAAMLIIFPNIYGIGIGLFLGFSSYIIDTETNDISLIHEANRSWLDEKATQQYVSRFEKIRMNTYALLDFISNTITTYSTYIVYGNILQISSIYSCVMGIVIGILSSLGILLLNLRQLISDWKRKNGEEFIESFFYAKTFTAILRFITILDTTLQIFIAYVLTFPGPEGIWIGLASSITSFLINCIVLGQIIFFEEKYEIDEKILNNNLISDLFIVVSIFCILLCSINALISAYNSIFALGTAVLPMVPAFYLSSVSIMMGSITFLCTFIFLITIAERMWDVMRAESNQIISVEDFQPVKLSFPAIPITPSPNSATHPGQMSDYTFETGKIILDNYSNGIEVRM